MKNINLAKKFTITLILEGLLILVVALVVGTYVYRETIKRQYNDEGFRVAVSLNSLFHPEELDEMSDIVYRFNTGSGSRAEIDAITSTPRYQELLGVLKSVRNSFNANDIFVYVMDHKVLEGFTREAYDAYDWNPMYYIMDAYHIEEEALAMGDNGAILEELLPDALTACREGAWPDNLAISRGSFGYNVTCMQVIKQYDDYSVFVGVEIPMSTLASDTVNFVRTLIIFVLATTIILQFIFITFITKHMVRPIVVVTKEASKFIETENEISTELSQINTGDEIQTLAESILKMEIDINDYIENLTKVTAEKERIGAELNVATKIQADMLPTIFPPFPDRQEFDIYASMDPAKEVGGDFYDFFMVDDTHLGMVMADVSGKGVPAALFMVISKTLIKNSAMGVLSPKAVLEKVNNQLCENNAAEMFVTVFFGILDITTGEVRSASAGHEYPALRGANGDYQLLKDPHGFVLAGMEGAKYKEFEFTIEKGGALFLYTDGVPEATSADKELYGTDRMLEALNSIKGMPVEDALPAVRKSIDDFVGEAEQFDDITMMIIKYKGR